MNRMTRALDQGLSQVEAGRPLDSAAAAIADEVLRQDVAGLLAIASELSATTFAEPPAAFRAELARQLSELDMADPPPAHSPDAPGKALPLLGGVVALLAVLSGMAGWAVLRGAPTQPRRSASLAPRAVASATLVARRAHAGAFVVVAPASPTAGSTPIWTPAGHTAAQDPRPAARTAVRPPSPTAGASFLAEAPTATSLPEDPGTVADTPTPGDPAHGSVEPTVVLSGRVLRGDEPMAGARVVVLRGEPGAGCADVSNRELSQTSSGVDGRFMLSGPATGDYRVFAEGGPACLPRRWHVVQLALSAADPCAATTYELRGQADSIQFVDVRYAPADGGGCPSPSP